MALQLISYPFRVNLSGVVATNEEGTDAQYTEELVMLIQTKPGERLLVPVYGLNDPTFGVIDPVLLQIQLDLFGPAIRIVNVVSKFTSAMTLRTEVTYNSEADDPAASIDVTSFEGAF